MLCAMTDGTIRTRRLTGGLLIAIAAICVVVAMGLTILGIIATVTGFMNLVGIVNLIILLGYVVLSISLMAGSRKVGREASQSPNVRLLPVILLFPCILLLPLIERLANGS